MATQTTDCILRFIRVKKSMYMSNNYA